MNVFVTLDYELFFGPKSGTVDNCLLRPTQHLIDIADKHNVRFTFFVDAGYLVKLEEFSKIHSNLKADFDRVVTQLQLLVSKGHDIQLHVHPHWEDATYDDKQWKIDITRYKLSDFNEQQVETIITKYKETLSRLTGSTIFAYRAGGWCIQPFNNISLALKKNKIFVDSTIYRNGLHLSEKHSYDFRGASLKAEWKFEKDPLVESEQGYFTELPISAYKISPLFYWKMYWLMRTQPGKFVPMGDGEYIKDKGKIYSSFFSPTHHFVSIDGYFASMLASAFKKHQRNKSQHFVMLGHPKSLAPYSLQQLDEFIGKYTKAHTFATFTGYFGSIKKK